MERSEQLTYEQERTMRDEPMHDPSHSLKEMESRRIQTASASEANMKACDTANTYRQNPRALIEERILFHNRAAQNLHDLLRGLPQEMSHGAEDALLTLLRTSRVAGQG